MLIQIILLHGFDVCISIVRLNSYVINNFIILVIKYMFNCSVHIITTTKSGISIN